jgi:hypothetical protein
MARTPFLAFILSLVLAGCGYSGDSSDGGSDGKTQDAADGTSGGDLQYECTPGVSRCPYPLDCLCCGSIGPAPICLCSADCNSNTDCTHPDLPECNKPGSGIAGICTPVGFNCCWECQ